MLDMFRSPRDRDGLVVKRVIAMEGDFITERGTRRLHRVSNGHMWLEGDNANVSIDSNSYGDVSVCIQKPLQVLFFY